MGLIVGASVGLVVGASVGNSVIVLVGSKVGLRVGCVVQQRRCEFTESKRTGLDVEFREEEAESLTYVICRISSGLQCRGK